MIEATELIAENVQSPRAFADACHTFEKRNASWTGGLIGRAFIPLDVSAFIHPDFLGDFR